MRSTQLPFTDGREFNTLLPGDLEGLPVKMTESLRTIQHIRAMSMPRNQHEWQSACVVAMMGFASPDDMASSLDALCTMNGDDPQNGSFRRALRGWGNAWSRFDGLLDRAGIEAALNTVGATIKVVNCFGRPCGVFTWNDRVSVVPVAAFPEAYVKTVVLAQHQTGLRLIRRSVSRDESACPEGAALDTMRTQLVQEYAMGLDAKGAYVALMGLSELPDCAGGSPLENGQFWGKSGRLGQLTSDLLSAFWGRELRRGIRLKREFIREQHRIKKDIDWKRLADMTFIPYACYRGIVECDLLYIPTDGSRKSWRIQSDTIDTTVECQDPDEAMMKSIIIAQHEFGKNLLCSLESASAMLAKLMQETQRRRATSV